jgi:hypothetical protein
VFYCSVRIEVLALASLFSGEVISRDVCGCFNKRVSVNIGCCSALWFLSSLVCSVFLIMFPEYNLILCV